MQTLRVKLINRINMNYFARHSASLCRPWFSSSRIITHNFRYLQICKIKSRAPKYLYFDRNSFKINSYSTLSNANDCDLPSDTDDEYRDLVNRYLHVPEMGHQVLVIQPYVKWGPSKKKNTTPDLQLDEATSLIGTLTRWQVVEQV